MTNKLKIYAVWTGAKDEAAKCAVILETGERLTQMACENEDAAREYFTNSPAAISTFNAVVYQRNTIPGPHNDPTFAEQHIVTYDGYELEFVGEADRTRYPQIAAMLGLPTPVEE